jgi:hypothetical protein
VETARDSLSVPMSVEEAHQGWLSWVGGEGTSTGDRASEALPADQVPEEAEMGQVYFSDRGDGTTEVTMELRYNLDALKEAGKDEAWIKRRIGMYLERYKESTGN